MKWKYSLSIAKTHIIECDDNNSVKNWPIKSLINHNDIFDLTNKHDELSQSFKRTKNWLKNNHVELML